MKFSDGDRVTDGVRTGTVLNYDAGFGAVGVQWDDGQMDYPRSWDLTRVPKPAKL